MKVQEFLDELIDIADNHKTLYVYGCFGAPLNKKNKARYKNNNNYNKDSTRQKMIDAASSGTFGFDCVCLIKGVLWGWNGNKNKTYGGATYLSNGVPDVGADSMINRYCNHVSSDFKNIKPGEAVWIPGHIGVYIGDNKVIECTPKWDNCVQYSTLGNSGIHIGKWRNWAKHGYLPWVDYSEEPKVEPIKEDPIKEENLIGTRQYKVQKGDTLTKIANRYGTTVDRILSDNKPKYNRISANFICVGWVLNV